MPNWVFCNLSFTSDDFELLDEIKTMLSQPYETRFPDHKWNEDTKQWDSTPATQTHESAFSFWNVVKPTDLDTYFAGESGKAKSNSPEDIGKRIADGFRFGMDWYNWNSREWGCKWDAGDVYLDETVNSDNSKTLNYRFETPWSPPMPIVERLVEMYPQLVIDFEYEEEQGWGGELTYVNGELTFDKSWDIPNSHADWMELDRVDSCNCQHEDDQEYWYDDCPRDLTNEQVSDTLVLSDRGDVVA